MLRVRTTFSWPDGAKADSPQASRAFSALSLSLHRSPRNLRTRLPRSLCRTRRALYTMSRAALLFSGVASAAAANPLAGRFGQWAQRSDAPSAGGAARGAGFIGFTGFSQGGGNSFDQGGAPSGFGAGSGYTPPSSGGFGGWGGYGGGISSYDQNGYSNWGNYNASSLPYYAGGGNYGGRGYPWGSINTHNSDPYTSAPNTGVTRTYHLTIANCNIKPDGVVTNGAICVNGM